MYCRPHGYPTAPLISYKITGIGALWEVVVPLSELSTLLAQRLILGHYVHSSTKQNVHLCSGIPPAVHYGNRCRLGYGL